MKRRDFLKSTLPTAALVHAGFHGPVLHADTQRSDEQVNGAYDLVVIGGTLSGCFAAWYAARKGLQVLLIERRTFLGTEITAAMRPWLQRDGFTALSPELKNLFLPDREQNEVGVPLAWESPSGGFGDEIPLFMGTVKKQFMHVLLQSKVSILVGTGVWGVLTNEERQLAAGVVMGSKFGLHLVRSQRIIDARSPTYVDSEGPVNGQIAFVLELYGVAPAAGSEVSVPESLDLVDNKVLVHKGKRKPGQRFIELRFVPRQNDVEQEARARTEKVCAHLIRKDPAFAKATIQQMAWETLAVARDGAMAQDPPYTNYECLRNRASFDLSCQDVVDVYNEARDLVNKFAFGRRIDARPAFIDCDSGRIPLGECQVTPVDDSAMNYAVQQITFPFGRYLPEAIRADVVVAGGGTGGAMAALGSVQEGAKTVTVEYLPELGGTSTVGRVTGYYAAYKDTGFFELIEDGVKKQGRLAGRCTRAVARMLHYRKQATQAGGTLLTSSIICGVIKDRQKVTGLVVEKAGRLFTIRGDVVIDATGDGDVAAFAGADYEVGNRRMLCTQNYSQWDVNPGLATWKDSSTNRDYDILWSHQLSEWQRGYQLSHQQAHYYDFTPFLTVRECRRITGDYTITLKDVILEHRHPDTICLAKSDFDPHHFGDTAFTRVGCLLPHGVSAVVEIPYRAILPRGIDNLLISAKAISQTHNALQFTRMSFDIMTLGYVTGRIAARVVKQGIKTREFDLAALQKELRDLKILPASQATEPVVERENDQLATHYIDELVAGKPNSLLKTLMQSSEIVEPSLRRAYGLVQRESEQLRLAKALAWFGNPLGNELILSEMKRLFEEEQAADALPREYYREDKGTPYWTINQDIALLALSGEPSVLPDILALADSLELGNPPVKQATIYNQGRIDLRLIPFYNRIVSLCFAIERMPHERAIPSLNRFLDDPFVRDHVSRTHQEAGDKVYGGILESRLAATLARCGDKRGFALLADYLNDVHPMLAHYASQELRTLLGADHGCDCQEWKAHVERQTFPITPTPCQEDVMEL